MGYLGGDPDTMTAGAVALRAAGVALEHLEAPVREGLRALADAGGDDVLAAAVQRFAAAESAVVGSSGTQTVVAAWLADHAATDLRHASGTGV